MNPRYTPPTTVSDRTDTVISSNQTEFPLSWNTSHEIIASDQAGRTISGIQTPHVHIGRPVYITNGGSYGIILASSLNTSGNRSECRLSHPDDLNMVLRPGDTFAYIYDTNESKWRLVSGYEGYLRDNRYSFTVEETFYTGEEANTNDLGTTGMRISTTGSAATAHTSSSGEHNYLGLEVSAVNDRASIFHVPAYPVQGQIIFQTLLKLPTLSTGSHEYKVEVGFSGSANFSSTLGIYFQYDRTNSTNWYAITDGGSSTSTDTGVAVDTDWHNFQIRYTASGHAYFRIDGTSVNNKTNVPDSTDNLYPAMFKIQKTATSIGTAERYLYVDSYLWRNHFTSQRLI